MLPTTHNPQPTTHNPQPTTHNPQPTTHHPPPTTKPKPWAQYFVTCLTAVLLLSLPFHLAQAADTVYAGTNGGLSISSDGGASFSNKTTTDGLGHNEVYSVAVSGSKVYAATSGGLSISTDGGASFSNKTTTDGLGYNTVSGVAVNGSTIYAATRLGGLSISSNGGTNFTNKTIGDGLGHNLVWGVAVNGNNVYAATRGGLSISTDGGASFSNKTIADGLGNYFVWGVAVNGNNVYAATRGGLSISSNGGASFSNKTTADGLGSDVVYGVAVSGSKVYAATLSGLSISTDGGASFSNKTTADGLGSDNVRGVAVNGNNVYAATSGGLSISSNGGASFSNKTTANGLGNNLVYGVAVVAGVPMPPTSLNATPASATQINLSWTDASTDETGFKIFQGGSLIHTSAANATSYNVTGLTCNTGYAFTVVATNAHGDSSATATTPATTTTAACSGGDNSTVFYSPPPQPDYYQINIGSPNGRVYTSPAGIDCNKGQGVCGAIFKRGQRITLNIETPEGLVFAGWTGSHVCSKGSFNIYNSVNCNALFYGDPNYVKTQPETNPSGNTDTVSSEQPKTYIHSFSVRANIAAKSACNLTQPQNPNEVLVAGFILRGSGSERVLINARGLEAGVEPKLLLKQTIVHPDGKLEAKGISENANWETHANAQNIPLAYRPKQTIDAALLLDLPAGIYTVTACMNSEAIVDSGIALVNVTPLDNKLSFSNASGRGFVGGGANDVFTGFTVLGTGQRQVQLNGKALDTNIIDTVLKIGRIYFDAVSNSVKGEEISNADDSSSNVIMNFTPGSYTTVLSSKSGKGGLGIVSMDFMD